MSAADDWVNLEGPPPPELQVLFDAGRRRARLEKAFLHALAADRRRRARARTITWGLAATGLAAAAVAAVWIAAGMAPPAPVPSAGLTRTPGVVADDAPVQASASPSATAPATPNRRTLPPQRPVPPPRRR